MKRILLIVPFLFFFHFICLAQGHDTLLQKLNATLDKKKEYDAQKLARIDKLQKDLNNAVNPDLNFRYNIYLKLYEENKSFNYDEAFHYAQKLQQTADALNDPVKI